MALSSLQTNPRVRKPLPVSHSVRHALRVLLPIFLAEQKNICALTYERRCGARAQPGFLCRQVGLFGVGPVGGFDHLFERNGEVRSLRNGDERWSRTERPVLRKGGNTVDLRRGSSPWARGFVKEKVQSAPTLQCGRNLLIESFDFH